jgi:pimeloyl-ACP methyl ester carboxylesterase
MRDRGMQRVELSAGPVEYLDTGGPGSCVVLIHGVLMNATLWREVVADLRRDHRCVVSTDGHLVELTDTHTLIPLDQPGRLAAHLRDFIGRG